MSRIARVCAARAIVGTKILQGHGRWSRDLVSIGTKSRTRQSSGLGDIHCASFVSKQRYGLFVQHGRSFSSSKTQPGGKSGGVGENKAKPQEVRGPVESGGKTKNGTFDSIGSQDSVGGGDLVGGAGGTVGLPHQVSGMYADMERTLMSKMHTHDKRQFRAAALITALATVWVLSVFGSQIRKYFASQTAEVAKETLKHESLQIQTQELATALVQALLNDQEVIGAGALFLREASTNPETQAALVSLALHILRHPDTLKEVQILANKLVKVILTDPSTVEQVAALCLEALKDQNLRTGLIELISALGQEEQVLQAVSNLAMRMMVLEDVQEKLGEMISSSSHKVLNDGEVLQHSKIFVAEVMGDDGVQRSGGDALWSSVQYALQTRVMKAVGFGLVCASVIVLGGGGGGSRN